VRPSGGRRLVLREGVELLARTPAWIVRQWANARILARKRQARLDSRAPLNVSR